VKFKILPKLLNLFYLINQKMKTYRIKKVVLVFFLVFGLHEIFYAQNFHLTQVDSLGKATIGAIIPNATSVRLRGLGGTWGLNNTNLPFTYMGNDLWQVTTTPIATGFHYYRMEVNGVLTSNPNEKIYYGGNAWTSGLEIPGAGTEFYSMVDVPHGTIRMQLYYSNTTGSYRRCFIYLPPSYDTRSIEKYPILFLQHGNSESEYSWHMQGKVNLILDNLIASGKALPMIVVMEDGMTFSNDYVGYADLVINDLIPLLENNYKVKTGKLNRAVAGLSMGGEQAIVAGLFNTDVFSYVGGFSGGIDYDWTPYAQNINDSIELLWMGWGTSDEYANYWIGNEAEFTSAGLNHVKVLMDGGHQWQVWRICLEQFAQLIFKPFEYPASVRNINGDNSLDVFPNPFNDQLNIKLANDKGSIYHCELYDISGKKLLIFNDKIAGAQAVVSEKLQSTSSGIYFLSVSDKQSVFKVRIIKK
jgi:enterochelin esterase-like enzyme